MNATQLLNVPIELGKENSDAINGALSGTARFFFEHTILFLIIAVIVILLGSILLSYMYDAGETGLQSILFAMTAYSIYMLVLFGTLVIIDTAESGILAGLGI
jgi:hypothetical protein